jgi:hypothetical protein
LEREGQKPPEHHFFVSDVTQHFREIGEQFLGRKLDRLDQIDLN